MVVSMSEPTLFLRTNKPDNPYLRLYIMLDTLQNLPDDYVIDKTWLRKELQYVFDYFMDLAKARYMYGEEECEQCDT